MSGPSGAGKSTLLKAVLAAEAKRRYEHVLHKTSSRNGEKGTREVSGLPFSLLLEMLPPKRTWLPSVASESGILHPLARFLCELPEHCPDCGEQLIRQTPEVLLAIYQSAPPETTVVQIELAIHSVDAFHDFQRQGFSRVLIGDETFRFEDLGSEMEQVSQGIQRNDCWLLVDSIAYHRELPEQGIRELLRCSKDYAGFSLSFRFLKADRRSEGRHAFHRDPFCPRCGFESAPLRLTDLSPAGGISRCSACHGAGTVHLFSEEQLIDRDRELPLIHGGLAVWSDKRLRPEESRISQLLDSLRIPETATWSDLDEERRSELLYGKHGERRFFLSSIAERHGFSENPEEYGVAGFLREMYSNTKRLALRLRIEQYLRESICLLCSGSRLNPTFGRRRIGGMTLERLFLSPISVVQQWIGSFSGNENLLRFLNYLCALGLAYVPLSQAVFTLSSGERQRLRLSRGLVGDLRGVLYLLDEPLGGLFPADRLRLLSVLKELVQEGNSIVAAENDLEFVRASDSAFALGPGGGASGGRLISSTKSEIVSSLQRTESRSRTQGVPRDFLHFSGVRFRNLQDLDLAIPLGMLVAIVGPSGSGKSTLVRDVVVPNMERRIKSKSQSSPVACRECHGGEFLAAVYDASRIASRVRGPSTLASFSGLLAPLRDLYQRLPHSLVMGNLESTRFQGLLLREVLERSVDEALQIFRHIPPVSRVLRRLKTLGLSYLVLGQKTATLSEGELQRVYLLRAIPKTLFHDDAPPSLLVCDEPARGLTGTEAVLMAELFRGLSRQGQSILVVEHNLHFLAEVDYLIELGPGGGPDGGKLLVQGAQKEIREDKASRIAQYLNFSTN